MRSRRLISALLSICLIFSLIPVSAYADEGSLSGNGILEDPYVINSVIDLQKVSDNLDACYELTTDLDIGGEWEPIAGSFTGNFDGAGHQITGITGFGNDNSGLFSSLSGAIISNLTVCSDGTVDTEAIAGLLAGVAVDTTLTNCGVEGSISRDGSGIGIAGLLCGTFSGTIQSCWAVGRVYSGGSGLSSASAYGGGFVGEFTGETSVDDSYAFVHVTALAASGYSEDNYAGGIAGYVSSDCTADIERCYVVGRIFYGDNLDVGDAFVGSCGNNADVSTEDSQYNGQISGIDGGLDTEYMLDADAYPNFDFDTVWDIDSSNGGYPYLRDNLPSYDISDLMRPWVLLCTPESGNCSQSTTLTQTFTFDREVELGTESSYFVNTDDTSEQLTVELTILNEGYAVKAETAENADYDASYSLIIPEGSIEEVRPGGYSFGGFEEGDYTRRVLEIPFSGGSGTKSDPFIILTKAQLTSISSGLDLHYKLGSDLVIDHPYQIGSSSEPFTGSLDGDGHSITGITDYFVNTDCPNNQAISSGLFQYAEDATIENLTLSGDISFYNQSYGNQYAALLVSNGTDLTLRNIHVSGSIVRRYTSVSGLLCAKLSDSSIEYCSAEGSIGSAIQNQQPSGGLVGYATNCSFTDCWTDVSLHGSYVSKNTLNYLGGISGVSVSSSYRNCLVTGSLLYSKVNGYNGIIAPIANNLELLNNVVISTPPLDAENCYYSIDPVNEGSMTSDTAQAIALSAEQLTSKASYSGFNFYEVWDVDSEIRNGYPYLNLRPRYIDNDDIDSVFPTSGSESVSFGEETAAYCTVTFADEVDSLAEAPQVIFEIYETDSNNSIATLHKVDCTVNGNTVSFSLESIGDFLIDSADYEIRMPLGSVRLNNGNQPYISEGEWTFRTTETKSITFNYRGGNDKSDKTEQCSYSDTMFEKSAFVYSPELTETSLCLAMSGFNSADAPEYKDKSINVKEFLNSAGFNQLAVNTDYETKPGLDTMGVAVGQKQLIQGDDCVTLVAVVLRGAGYENEWGGNFTLGNNGSYHLGFQTARDEAIKTLEQYLQDNNVTGKVKFWITGYSRSAATANLLAGAMVDYDWNYSNIEYTNNDIYAYCFEPPAGRIFTSEQQNGNEYNCIKNIVNPCDVVPMVAPSYFKFGRYGIDLYLPGPSTALNFPDTLSAVKEEYAKISDGDTFGYMNGQEAFLSYSVNKISQNIKSLDNYVYNYQPAMRTKVSEIFSNEKIVEPEGVPLAILTAAVDNIIVPSINEAGTKGVLVIPEALATATKYNLITSFNQNIDNIKHAHYPEVTLAWVRTVNEADYNDGQFRLVRVNCPVAVEIYHGSTLVASISEDGANDIFGSSIGAWLDDSGQMVIALPWDSEYSVKMTATDNGTVTYSVSEFSITYGTTRVVNYYEVPVEIGDILTGTIENAESLEEQSQESVYELTSTNSDTAILSPEEMNGNDIETCNVTLNINGSGTVIGQSSAQKGEFVRLTAIADNGNRFVGWYKNGTQISTDAQYRFCLKADCELTAVFASTSGGNSSNLSNSSSTLTFQTNGGSTISKISITSGKIIDLSAYITTRNDYVFDGWYSDSAFTNKVTSVKLTGNTTVYAKWIKNVAENPFVDVPEGSFFHDAVLWAIDKNITTGTTETTFSPNATCTRAQAVTLIWNAYGSPEPNGSIGSFSDVSTDSVYAKAIAWAVEQGIANGTSTTKFSPDNTVTRAQAMAFLWRSANKPTTNVKNQFTDVLSGAYYETAVDWSINEKITSGTSATTFSPDVGCTRGQLVTFLYRQMVK